MLTHHAIRALLAAAMLCPSTLMASPIGVQVPCPNCSDAQMRAKALQVLPNTPGVFSTHLYSLPTNVIKNFEVECMTQNAVEPGEDKSTDKGAADSIPDLKVVCNGNRLLAEIPAVATVVTSFNALRQAWVDTRGSMRKDLTLHVNQIAGQSPTVYDIAGSWQMQQQMGTGVYNWMLSNSGNYLSILGSAVHAWAGFTDGMTIMIKLTTTDGGFVIYEWKIGEVQAYYKSGSGRTTGGQAVPENQDQANHGIWNQIGPNGNFDDLREFALYLQRHGMPVYRANGTPVGTVMPGPIYKITCEKTTVNGQEVFICRIQELP